MIPLAIVSLEWDIVDLVESTRAFSITGFFDPVGQGATADFPHLGADASWSEQLVKTPGLKVALAIDDPLIKSQLFTHYGADAIVLLQSPHAYVSPRAEVGHGCLIQRGVTIMPNARLGRTCKVNVNATLHHDVRVDDFCTIAPGAQLLGHVAVGPRVYVGAGAIVRQRCTIGEGAFIGAGAVVVRDVPAGATIVGVPASRRLR